MENNNNNKKHNSTPYFYCKLCDYSTIRRGNYKNHCMSIKHKTQKSAKNPFTNPNLHSNSNPDSSANASDQRFKCIACDKWFKERTGLWRHKKKCSQEPVLVDGIDIRDKDALVMHLLKQNGQLQDKLIALSMEKSVTTTTMTTYNNNNNTNTNNNAFNLNFFLNETCKHAMNITEFVNSIKISLEDLEHTGRTGYIEGVSNIIVQHLSKLEPCYRPMHCSDFKREVIYIKDDNNQWMKETHDKPILTKAIKTIANENIKQIQHWREKNPDCSNADSKHNNLYLKIVSNSMNGLTKEEGVRNINKIISNIARETTIQKW
jgi:hypothetical protein